MAKGISSKTANGSALEFEAQLWAAADKMRGHMDASECYPRTFASAEGKGGGEFYTPQCVVQVLVAMLEPYKGRVFETLQSANTNCRNRRMNGDFSLSASNGERAGVRCRNFGINRRGVQNIRRRRWPCASTTTWKLARMNLAIRGIDANLGPRNADSFRRDLHPDLKADFILANPPFNMSDWGGENLRADVRWKFGMPPVNNANPPSASLMELYANNS